MKLIKNPLSQIVHAFACSLVSVLLFCVLAAAEAAPKIAFERGDAIWIANMDGSAAKKLVGGNLPEISPDGARVAFNTDEPGEKTPIRHIAIVEISTGKVTRLNTPSNNSFGPVWSPDGSKLLFSTFIDNDWQLALMNTDGTGYRIVKKAQAKDHSYGSPAWSANGKSYFCHDLDSIYQLDLDGNVIKKWDIHAIITNGDMNSNSRMAASPDGNSLIMDVDMNEEHNRDNWDGPPPAIWLLSFASGKATRLTEKGYFGWDPFWITSDEFVFASQGPKEKEPSLYRGSAKGGPYQLIVKSARTPSVSR